MSKILEEAVAKTATVVADWRTKIAKIETQIAAESQSIAIATKQREEHVLAATLGDSNAVTAIKAARSKQHDAEQRLADLSIALPAARLRLVEAEREAKTARNNLARFEVGLLQRKRIDVAEELDQVSADFARLYGEYEKLGREIVNMPDALPQNSFGITNNEGAMGLRRVRASLPAFFWKLFPGALHDEMKTENLAVAEARYWNLAAEPDEKAKAA